jgi:hypothetical protein
VVGLQLLTILLSRGNIFVLGEAYAFGVMWSFAMKGLAVLVLRYKQPGKREFRVPLNLKVGNLEVPLGLGLITVTLFTLCLINGQARRSLHHDRRAVLAAGVPPPGPNNRAEVERDNHIQMVVDLRRAVDVLVARKDVDPKRIGYVGHSLGATWGRAAGRGREADQDVRADGRPAVADELR